MSDAPTPSSPVAVFDSGVGGLSVLREIRRAIPSETIIYFGDQGHVPYGPRPLAQVREFSIEISRYLISRGAKIIVVACNSASAAALAALRATYPSVPFVGMEPAVKPAAETTATGVVGVLATPATFQGELYASVVERFATGVELLKSTCPGLVQQIERGDLEGDRTRTILNEALRPMLERGIDTVVLACTHYPFVIPLIKEIVGVNVRVIDPGPAIARQVARILGARGLRQPMPSPQGTSEYLTSSDPARFARIASALLGEPIGAGGLTWQHDKMLVDGQPPAAQP